MDSFTSQSHELHLSLLPHPPISRFDREGLSPVRKSQKNAFQKEKGTDEELNAETESYFEELDKSCCI